MRQFILTGIKRSTTVAISTLFIFLAVVPIAAAEEQPIAFSHEIHATQDQIPCQYCHIYARRSFSSGVPPVSICLGCHGTKEAPLIFPESVEVNKMRDYWSKKEPIPWVKIHDLPDYVRFPHKKHITADAERFKPGAEDSCDEATDARSLACKVKAFKQGGDVRCTACHGDIKTMPVIQVVDNDFGEMGWCLKCHLQVKGVAERKTALNTLGGWFNAKEQEATRATMIDLKNKKLYHNPVLTDCYTCHY